MKKIVFLFTFFMSIAVYAQDISDMNFESFYRSHIARSKGLVIVNFWATWCKPCVEELPDFEKINSQMKSESFNVILVNLDFNSKFKTAATEFVAQKNIRSEVVHINDTDPNVWIDKVDESWSGAIPATAMYLDGEKKFFKEGKMKFEEIKSAIENILNQSK